MPKPGDGRAKTKPRAKANPKPKATTKAVLKKPVRNKIPMLGFS